MGLVRIYTAVSADGYIADSDGGVDWLAGFDPTLYGFDGFIGEVGAVVLGRRTFDYTLAFEDWPYADKQAYIVTSHPFTSLPAGTVVACKGLATAIDEARGKTRGDVWIVGGAATLRGALELGLVDRIELFLVPKLIGEGIGIIGPLAKPIGLALDSIETFADGVVKITYHPARG